MSRTKIEGSTVSPCSHLAPLGIRGSLVGELNRGPVMNSPAAQVVIGCSFGQASETGARTGPLEIFHRPAEKVVSPQFNQIPVDLGCLEKAIEAEEAHINSPQPEIRAILGLFSADGFGCSTNLLAVVLAQYL